ncbi:MAG: Ig-like domain repeat protein [Pseudonocardiaceae bacterium]
MQFNDGTTAIDGPVTVTNGTATITTTLPVGTHSLSAVFTPTDPTAFGSSTSPPVSLTVKPLFPVQ